MPYKILVIPDNILIVTDDFTRTILASDNNLHDLGQKDSHNIS